MSIPPFLGVVELIKVVSEFSFGHPKCHFWALENGHFWQKCSLLGTKKSDFECPNLKTETTFISPTSPKIGGIDICFDRLSLLSWPWDNFHFLSFLSFFWADLEEEQNKSKMAG